MKQIAEAIEEGRQRQDTKQEERDLAMDAELEHEALDVGPGRRLGEIQRPPDPPWTSHGPEMAASRAQPSRLDGRSGACRPGLNDRTRRSPAGFD
jgi:hypothetical protein